MDDGSEDDTEALVRGWVADGALDIEYVQQENRGQYAAVNRGVRLARGAFTTILDSDDWFVADALERLLETWEGIPETERAGFAGVVGLCAFADGRVVGDRFPADPLDCDAAELAYVLRVAGDKHGLMRTSVLREFPFPFEGSYVAPGLVWNRVALRYRERHVNEVVKIVEYQPAGLSERSLALQVGTPLPMRQFFLEELRLPHRLPLRRRVRSYANYARFSLHSGIALRTQAADAPSVLAWLALLPLGLALFLRDRRRLGPSASAGKG